MEKYLSENEDTVQNCNFCTRSFKSSKGLEYHMQKIHPLDVTSGLSCYTCNKTFSKRDLIENHFKTVKHQLECKRLKQEEEAEQRCQNYKTNLMKMDNFKVRPQTERNWNLNRTEPVNITLESTSKLPDPRHSRKRKIDFLKEKLEATTFKVQKLKREAQAAKSQNLMNTANIPEKLDLSTENYENSVISQSEDTDEPRIEHTTENTEFQAKIPGTAQSPFQGRSTPKCADSPKIDRTSSEEEIHLEINLDDSIDIIPSKTSDFWSTEEIQQDNCKEMPKFISGTRSIQSLLTLEDTVEIHVTATEEDTIDQDLDQFITEYFNSNPIEIRTVKLDNQWTITDSIGTPDFPQLLQEDPNFDLLTFITEKLPF